MVLLGTATLFLSETSESSAYNLTALSKLPPLFLFILLAPVFSGAQVSISGLERLKDDPDATGRLLLNELQCVGCHTPPKVGFAGLPAKTAPDLGDVGSRLRESWVEGFIATPLTVAPGSGHPDILVGKAETSAKVQAESITHYLMMQKRSQPISETRGNVDKGRDLYGKVGCAACHGEAKSLDPGAKYATTTAFAEFLRDPHRNNPGRRMPSLNLTKEEALDIATFLIKTPGKAGGFISDFDKVKQGQSFFKSLNCTACHTVGPSSDLIQPEGILGPLPTLTELAGKEDQGCLNEKPTGSWPWFGMDDSQRKALTGALAQVGKPSKSAPVDRIAARMSLLNCYACHSRDGVGGVDKERDAHFLTAEPAMGPEGRLPPHLDRTGAKLNPTWLREVLGKGTKVRPYMLTRMPAYGSHNTSGLADDFAAADKNKIPPTKDPPAVKIREALKQGRLLVGAKGLACVSCHTFGGAPSLGVQGMDLAVMKKRLQADWFRRYMVNPIALRPGTRMPSFWPDGNSTKPDILGGDSGKQIEAIWKYLALGEQAAPAGASGGGLLITASDEASIYRNFIQDAGPRAIGVGYPGEVNLAWDANHLRPALIWQGPFIDGAKHWTGRGQGFQKPAGFNTLKLPQGHSLAILGDPDEAWPDGQRGPHAQFKGYQLDESRFPTFRYNFHGIEATDFYEPYEASGSFVLRRTLKLEGKPVEGLTYLAARGSNISVFEPNGKFRLGDLTITVTISGDEPNFKLRKSSEVTVPIDLSNGSLTLTQVYDW